MNNELMKLQWQWLQDKLVGATGADRTQYLMWRAEIIESALAAGYDRWTIYHW